MKHSIKNQTPELRQVVLPAAVAHFDELQDVFCAPDLLLLEPHHLNLLLAVLQHPQLSLTVQQVKHLRAPQCVLERAFFSAWRK